MIQCAASSQTASGDVPEFIAVGVPSNSTTRNYDLTYSQCNPALMNCSSNGFNPSGGTEAYISWLMSTVLPNVTTALNFQVFR